MKKTHIWNTYLPAFGLAVAVGLGVAAFVLGDQLTAPMSGLCFGLAGAIGGLAGSRLAMAHFDRTWTPEQRKEIQRAERDERNRMIWGKAAYFTWQVTLFLLLAAFVALYILECPPGAIAVLAVLLLSFVTYLAATRFYDKRY